MSTQSTGYSLPSFDTDTEDEALRLPEFDPETGEILDDSPVELPSFDSPSDDQDAAQLPNFTPATAPALPDFGTSDAADDDESTSIGRQGDTSGQTQDELTIEQRGFRTADDTTVPTTGYKARFDPRVADLPDTRPQLGRQAIKNADAHTHRADPFYDKLWQFGSQAAWASYEGVVKHRKDGSALLLPSGVIRRDKAIELVKYGEHRSQRIAMLSALDSWGTVTAEQMVALTGYRNLLHPDHEVPMSLFSTSLMDIGRLQNSMLAVRDDPRSTVYRHRSPRGRIRSIAKRAWTSAEYLQVDAGVNFAPSLGFMDRHNIMSTEFALRCAESHPDVNMVLGEKWSSGDSLLPHTRKKVGFHRTSEQHPVRGDCTIIMRNGLRVVIEMTSGHSASIYKKLNRWAQFLTRHSLAESGVVVLFVMASSKYSDGRDYETSVSTFRSWMKYVLRRFPSRGQDSAAARMGLARWTDLFPAKHQLGEEFYQLAAEYHDVGWDKKPLETFDVEFNDPHLAAAPIAMAPVLAATPHWWRRGDQTPLIGLPSMRADETPLTDDQTHLTTTGAVDHVNPPSRLRAVGARRRFNSADDVTSPDVVDETDDQAAHDGRTKEEDDEQ